mgnify:FL=1|jgi:hypothetical protein
MFLIESSADVDALDASMSTPLHCACWKVLPLPSALGLGGQDLSSIPTFRAGPHQGCHDTYRKGRKRYGRYRVWLDSSSLSSVPWYSSSPARPPDGARAQPAVFDKGPSSPLPEREYSIAFLRGRGRDSPIAATSVTLEACTTRRPRGDLFRTASDRRPKPGPTRPDGVRGPASPPPLQTAGPPRPSHPSRAGRAAARLRDAPRMRHFSLHSPRSVASLGSERGVCVSWGGGG